LFSVSFFVICFLLLKSYPFYLVRSLFLSSPIFLFLSFLVFDFSSFLPPSPHNFYFLYCKLSFPDFLWDEILFLSLFFFFSLLSFQFCSQKYNSSPFFLSFMSYFRFVSSSNPCCFFSFFAPFLQFSLLYINTLFLLIRGNFCFFYFTITITNNSKTILDDPCQCFPPVLLVFSFPASR
jgi:hypothetical protein